MSRPAPVTAHTAWCDRTHTRDGVKRCIRRIGRVGRVGRIHIFVSGMPTTAAQVGVDGNGALSRLSVEDALELQRLIGQAIAVAGGDLVEDETDVLPTQD